MRIVLIYVIIITRPPPLVKHIFSIGYIFSFWGMMDRMRNRRGDSRIARRPNGTNAGNKQKDQLPSYHVIARRAKPDAAIRILSGAKHRPSPMGTERERIATSLRSSQ